MAKNKTTKKRLKKTLIDTVVSELEKKNAIIDAILLSFVDNLVYDYPIPPRGDIANLVREAMRLHDWPKTFKNKVLDIIRGCRDEYTRLDSHLANTCRFGSEFFYGYGTLLRWRAGEREKAEERVKQHISTRELKHVAKLQEILRPEVDEKVPDDFHKMLFKKINGGKYVFP